MSWKIECPDCGESADLKGHPSAEGIVITCGRCDTTWLRDAVPRKCATCGGIDLEECVRALAQYSRGTQLSIVGYEPILLCRTCDQQMIEWSRGGRLVPFTYQSSALEKNGADDHRGTDGDGHVLLTP